MTGDQNDRNHLGRATGDAMIPVAPPLSEMDDEYLRLIEEIKRDVTRTRLSVVSHGNAQMIMLYWRIGHRILQKQEERGWGAKVIDRMSLDLRKAFPDVTGFSASNLKSMRRFAQAWPDASIGQQAVAQLPWGSNLVLLSKLKDPEERLWYAERAVAEGWSRSVLTMQIESHLIDRVGWEVNNFPQALPPADSDMAVQAFKDPYYFGFLGAEVPRRELEVERRLSEHIEDFLLELGRGFAFVGREVPLEVGGQSFRIDMLFYHLRLRCYVVIELKAREFEPAFVGQLNLYRNAVDDLLRQEGDGRTIGLLLVRGKSETVVRYALGGLDGPIGVADWEAGSTAELPGELGDDLPTVEEIERELGSGDEG